MDCIKLKTCLFFNDKLPMEHGLGGIYKKKYCLGDNTRCARYIVVEKLGPDHVPDNLFPSMIDLAYQIIEAAESQKDKD